MDRIQHLPLAALRESPFNHRKTFTQSAIVELAESIKSQGILQPLVARPLYPGGDAPTNARERYEIVFGHRRSRAASLAGLEHVPVIVREMDDQAAAIAQVHENVQREDVSALEEADGYVHLQKTHGMNADQIAQAVGKSRSHVYGRLKLVAASDAVRTAMLERGLPADIALEVARLRGHGVQQAALHQLKSHGSDDWISVREAKRKLRAMFTHKIDAVEWNPADAKLCKGVGACSHCPKLAANDPDLAELAADVCTDSTCFMAKSAAHADQQTAELRRMGHTVLDGAEAQAAMPYPDTSPNYLRGFCDYEQICDTSTTPEATLERLRAAGREVPAPVYLRNPATHALVRVWRDADLEAIDTAVSDLDRAAAGGAATPSSAARAANGADDDDHLDRLAEWTPSERVFADFHAVDACIDAVLTALRARMRTTDDLRVMVLREYELAGELTGRTATRLGIPAAMDALEAGTDERMWLENHLALMPANDLAFLLVGLAVEDQLAMISWCGTRNSAARRVALARHYGVEPAMAAAAAAENSQNQTDDAGDAGGVQSATQASLEEATA